MLFQKEIHQVNQLTKRFNRDCRKIFAQIQDDIKQATLTKDEVKTLIESFGKIKFVNPIISSLLEPHIDIWESRANCSIHQFDDFLNALEPVSSFQIKFFIILMIIFSKKTKMKLNLKTLTPQSLTVKQKSKNRSLLFIF